MLNQEKHEERNNSNDNPATSKCAAAKSTKWTLDKIIQLQMPNTEWTICQTTDKNQKAIVHINPSNFQIDKTISFRGSEYDFIFRGTVTHKPQNVKEKLENVADAQKVLNTIHMMRVCEGTGIGEKPFSIACNGPALPKGKRCSFCNSERDRLRKKESRQEVVKKRVLEAKQKQKSRIQSLKRSKIRLILKVKYVVKDGKLTIYVIEYEPY